MKIQMETTHIFAIVDKDSSLTTRRTSALCLASDI